MHFKSASDLRELEILERRKIRVVEEDYGYDDDEAEDEDHDGRFYSGSSSGLGYSERSTRSQACSNDDLLGKSIFILNAAVIMNINILADGLIFIDVIPMTFLAMIIEQNDFME